ncbi:MAG: hypothetical protein ACLPTF_03995 [Steroidobacteraceae bacterium]
MVTRTTVRIREARLKLRGDFAFVAVIALGNFAPSVNWAGSIVADPPKRESVVHQGSAAADAHNRALTPHRVLTPLRNAASDEVTERSRADTMGVARHASIVNVVAKVSGNAVSRHAAVASVIGGPARYDAKKGAMIGGSMMRHKR